LGSKWFRNQQVVGSVPTTGSSSRLAFRGGSSRTLRASGALSGRIDRQIVVLVVPADASAQAVDVAGKRLDGGQRGERRLQPLVASWSAIEEKAARAARAGEQQRLGI
jgi:hypothetical protein